MCQSFGGSSVCLACCVRWGMAIACFLATSTESAPYCIPPALHPALLVLQLKLVAPTHAIVKRSEEGEAAFDRAASAVSA